MFKPEFYIRQRSLSNESSYSTTTIESFYSIKFEQDLQSTDNKICNFYKKIIAYFMENYI